MININDNNYRKEIEELTEYLRVDEEWAKLRNILIKKNFNVQNLYLVSFVEDEEDNEYGAFVTKEKDVFEYSILTRVEEGDLDNFTYKKLNDSQYIFNTYPQVKIAFEMIDAEI